MIAAEGRTQLSVDGLERRTDQHGSHREAVGDALGHGDDIRTDVEPLVSEELTASSVATLYLVADQDRPILLAGSSQTLGKFLCGEFDAAHALDTLQNYSTDITLCQLRLPRRQVVHRQIGHVAVVVDGGDDLWIVRHLHSQTCTAMESLLAREHPCPAVSKRCQFQGILVGLGTAIDEEQLVVVVARDLA